MANALYSQKDYEGAANTLEKLSKSAPESQYADRYYFNKGNVSLQKKDYKTAVDDFKQALLREPGDLQAKESYIYAKKMLENQENGGEGESNQDKQDQNGDDQQNQDQQPSDGQQDKQEGEGQAQQQQISAQQAQQILKAIQAKEKETQEKVEKAKAQNEKSRQKDKNW